MASVHVCILQTSFAKRDDTVAFLKEQVPGVRVEFITDSTLPVSYTHLTLPTIA